MNLGAVTTSCVPANGIAAIDEETREEREREEKRRG